MSNRRRTTIGDIAKAAKVSKMSVSRVLNNQKGVSPEKRSRILATIKHLQYSSSPVARSLRGNSRMIGLVIPNITTGYAGSVLAGVSDAANRLKYGLMLYTLGVEAERAEADRSNLYATQLAHGLVEGALLVIPSHRTTFTAAFKASDFPYVVVDEYSETSDDPAVTSAARSGIQSAMRHLLALGHERIGFITGPLVYQSAVDRLNGYKDALEQVGIPFDPRLVREGDWYQRSGFDNSMSLLQLRKRPTAIVASSDNMAIGAIDAVKELDLQVPGDISVVGFNDIPNAKNTRPPLTTVRVPMEHMGSVAMELLVDLIEGRSRMLNRIEVAVELIVRESTARPKGG